MGRRGALCFVALMALLPAVEMVGGSSGGGDGFRGGGLPRGYEEVDLAHFQRALMRLWSKLTKRDPGELAGKIALALGAQHLSRYAQTRGLRASQEPCLPPELRPIVNRIDTACALIQLGYDPSKGSKIMGMGPLQNFKIVQANWEAGVFRPAYVILQNVIKPHRFWVVVRGTYSVEDIMTDLTVEPEKFMDGHVHKGVLRAGTFVAQELKECLKKSGPVQRGKMAAKPEIFLVGHSLGGAAAAIATAVLQIDGVSAKSVVFGAPSCIYRATYLENMLARHVTHLVLDSDIIPRLNNETVAKLLDAQEGATADFVAATRSFIFDSLRMAVRDNRPLTRVLGLDVGDKPCMQCPPGRSYVFQQRPEGAKEKQKEGDKSKSWAILPVECDELSKIILSPRMISDHNVQSYIDAVQDAFFRYLPVCGAASSTREL